MSLCLTIQKGQCLYIGNEIVVKITKLKSNGCVGVSVDAPLEYRILREGVKPDEPEDATRRESLPPRPLSVDPIDDRDWPSSLDPIFEYLSSQGMPISLSTNQIVDWIKAAFMDAETESKRLQAIGERLPHDAAGNVKLPGDKVFRIGVGRVIETRTVGWLPASDRWSGYHAGFGGMGRPDRVEECYSTAEEVEAARAEARL